MHTPLRQLWYTPRRLMHDDTSQMWRVTRVTFKYHGTLRNLVGAPASRLNGRPRILLSEITSSTASLPQIRLAYFFFLRLFAIFNSAELVLLLFLFSFNLTNRAGKLHFSLVLYGVCDSTIIAIWYFIWQWGACAVGHLKRLQAPCTSPYSNAAQCNALSINHWTVCCFHNGVVKARSGS